MGEDEPVGGEGSATLWPCWMPLAITFASCCCRLERAPRSDSSSEAEPVRPICAVSAAIFDLSASCWRCELRAARE